MFWFRFLRSSRVMKRAQEKNAEKRGDFFQKPHTTWPMLIVDPSRICWIYIQTCKDCPNAPLWRTKKKSLKSENNTLVIRIGRNRLCSFPCDSEWRKWNQIFYLNYETVDGVADLSYQFPRERFINAGQHRTQATVLWIFQEVFKSKACIFCKAACRVYTMSWHFKREFHDLNHVYNSSMKGWLIYSRVKEKIKTSQEPAQAC